MQINGKQESELILKTLQEKRKNFKEKIIFKIISFKNNIPNQSFIKIKKNFAEKLNILCEVHYLNENKTNEELKEEIKKISLEKDVKGVIIQLPIPKHLNKETLLNAIPSNLDIDCLTYENLGKFYQNTSSIIPPTVLALDYLIKKYDLVLDDVLLLGQGDLIGKPIAQYLLNNHIDFININNIEKNIDPLCLKAKVIITGAGKANLIKYDSVKQDTIIFDYSCNKTDKICGDCESDKDFENICSFFTPVPNGLGPIVVAKLFENLLR
jgi:methylenetetrahydrofolate dehydrogenase (NADP+) / methenyltetrahydrofolate cyclohydrolase